MPTAEGWLHLALILDVFSRKLVGWAMNDSMAQDLTLEALRMALGWRDPPSGLVHHSDRGSEYAAHDYRRGQRLQLFVASITRVPVQAACPPRT